MQTMGQTQWQKHFTGYHTQYEEKKIITNGVHLTKEMVSFILNWNGLPYVVLLHRQELGNCAIQCPNTYIVFNPHINLIQRQPV